MGTGKLTVFLQTKWFTWSGNHKQTKREWEKWEVSAESRLTLRLHMNYPTKTEVLRYDSGSVVL